MCNFMCITVVFHIKNELYSVHLMTLSLYCMFTLSLPKYETVRGWTDMNSIDIVRHVFSL